MKKAFIFIACTVALIVALDLVCGIIIDNYVKNHRLPGDCASIDYVVKDANEDIVILGNSVALNSLNPDVFIDSLGMTCYNGSSNGQRLVFFETLLKSLLRHHTPKIVVLGLNDDVLHDDDIGDRYNILIPYYGQGQHLLDSCMEARGHHERLLLKSSFYRYNTIWWRILLYHFVKAGEAGNHGFIAKPVIDILPPIDHAQADTITSTPALLRLKSIINTCRANDVQLLLFIPPSRTHYTSGTTAGIVAAKKMAVGEGVPFLDDFQNPELQSDSTLFYDVRHLNAKGADIYSKHFVKWAKDKITLHEN